MKRILLVLLLSTISAVADGSVAQLAESYNEFGLRLLTQTRQAAPEKNVFLSPVGLAFALSMAADGAKGETLRQMRATLRLENATDLNEANLMLFQHLTGLNPKIKLEIANSLWTAHNAKIKETFLDSSLKFYEAAAQSVDFKDPATVNRINAWCGEHTHGKIPKMVQAPLDPNGLLRLVLLDAIYFKGDWFKPFEKKLTRDLPFTLAGGGTIQHPRMSRTGKFEYFENENFQEVRLPYAGNAISMYVFLPKKGLDDFLQNLTMENWRHWVHWPDSRQGTLELPRFKLENEYDFKKALMALGMTAAFSAHADFSGISSEPLHIGWVKQKTYVDVNEEGTEAAAVTGIGIVAMALRHEEPPFRMVVDRPFFLAICDDESGTILFLGAINDPR